MKPVRALALTTMLSVGCSIGMALPAQASSTYTVPAGGINFNNDRSTDVLEDPQVGQSFTYSNVATIDGQVIDAKMTVLAVDGLASDSLVDNGSNDPDFSRLIQMELDYDRTGYLRLNIQFFKGGTTEPVTLENLFAQAKDIDQFTSGPVQEYVQFTGVQAFELADPTAVIAKTSFDDSDVPYGAYRFLGTEQFDDEGIPDHVRSWAEVSFKPLSSFEFEVGAIGGSAGSAFEFVFNAMDWGAASTTVTTAIDFPESQSVAEDAPPPWLQSYGRSQTGTCRDGWHPSWAEWAVDKSGGWVCNRTVFWTGTRWVQNPNQVWGNANSADTTTWDGN